MQLSTRGRALETKQFDMGVIWKGINAQVRIRLDEIIKALEELYQIGSATASSSLEQPQPLSTKLLTIYQYFSDDARISTYLKLLNVDESGKKQSTHSQPKYLLEYLKYVRIIHFKYYQTKKATDQTTVADAMPL